MKVFLFALAVVLVAAAMSVDATPTKKKVQPKCDFLCSADYTPVCGAVPDDKSVKPKLFGNECVLNKYNCDNKSNLVVVAEQLCANAGGVRLS